jgi:hypothetical protein
MLVDIEHRLMIIFSVMKTSRPRATELAQKSDGGLRVVVLDEHRVEQARCTVAEFCESNDVLLGVVGADVASICEVLDRTGRWTIDVGAGGVFSLEPEHGTVTWMMPREAARLLRETLAADARSTAFDAALRERIQRALDEVDEQALVGAVDRLVQPMEAAARTLDQVLCSRLLDSTTQPFFTLRTMRDDLRRALDDLQVARWMAEEQS